MTLFHCSCGAWFCNAALQDLQIYPQLSLSCLLISFRIERKLLHTEKKLRITRWCVSTTEYRSTVATACEKTRKQLLFQIEKENSERLFFSTLLKKYPGVLISFHWKLLWLFDKIYSELACFNSTFRSYRPTIECWMDVLVFSFLQKVKLWRTEFWKAREGLPETSKN